MQPTPATAAAQTAAAHLWPKPNSFSLRFFTPSMKPGMLSVLPMRSSMRSTASLAPPWRGPYSAPTPPPTALYTSTPLLARCLWGGQDAGHRDAAGRMLLS